MSRVQRDAAALGSALLLASRIPAALGFSFNINNAPQQCRNLSISITGSDGIAPYRALVVPFGATPLPGAVEVRKIIDQPFGGGSATVSFPLNYPSDSQFIVVVSDSTGFGTGGTSVAATVLSSSDSSCFNTSQTVSPQWVFNIAPPNQIVQCQATRFWWDPNAADPVQGSPTFVGVIPGGDSFSIPNGPLTQVAQEGTGFDWTASVVGGTSMLIVAGDSRGAGSGGSFQFTVASGINPTSSCLNSTSPSSTPGSPAGGAYPTNINGSGTGGGGGGGSNVGAIVGGVIGGLVALLAFILVLVFFRRRRRLHRQQGLSKERPDLFIEDDHGNSGPDQDREGIVEPEPYIVPTEASIGHAHTSDGRSSPYGLSAYDPNMSERDRRLSAISATTGTSAPGGPGPGTVTSGTRKSAIGPSLRPVNIIQHEDMGIAPEEGNEEEPETVELPPAYTNLRPSGSGS